MVQSIHLVFKHQCLNLLAYFCSLLSISIQLLIFHHWVLERLLGTWLLVGTFWQLSTVSCYSISELCRIWHFSFITVLVCASICSSKCLLWVRTAHHRVVHISFARLVQSFFYFFYTSFRKLVNIFHFCNFYLSTSIFSLPSVLEVCTS